MKNKTKTYLLLFAVLAIWGTIGYKFVSSLSLTPKIIQQSTAVTSFKPKTNTKLDTFSIQNLDRDPFLGTLYSSNKSTTSSKKAKEVVDINTPLITYKGLVKKQNTSDQVFVVNINENQYLLKQGQTVDSVKLIKGNTKEIVIRYKNNFQTLKRK